MNRISIKRKWNAYQVGFSSGKISVFVDGTPDEKGIPSIGNRLVGFVKLIQLLENHGYIYLHTPHNIFEEHRNMHTKRIGDQRLHDSSPPIFVSTQIKEELASFFLKEITVTEELQQYVRNGFKTKSDIRHTWQVWRTWVAITISFVVGFISILLSIFDRPNRNALIQSIEAGQAAEVKALDSLNTTLKMIYKQFPVQPDSLETILSETQPPTD